MKQILLYSAALVVCSFLGFAGTLYFLPKYDEAAEKSRSVAMPEIINQEFEHLSTSELVSQGVKLWQQKNYTRSFKMLEVAYSQTKPNSGLRTKASLFLGLEYYYGQGADKDMGRALEFLTAPGLANTRQAVYLSGLIMRDKKNAEYDIAKARIYLKKAEDMGIKKAGIELDKIGRQ